MAREAVTLTGLGKTYPGGKRAVDGVTLALGEGEVFGFLGPNGAGKTTTVKLLTGMLVPTDGESRVMGLDPAREPEKVHALCGVVTEHAQMYERMTGLENLIFFGRAFGMGREESAKRGRELLERLDLAEGADKRLAAYSTGMRQRLSLARAMMHRPPVLFLDEPTSGLDPESALGVNRLLVQLAREEGVTVFLCTHQLRYAQEVCTRFGLMDRGRLLAEGSLDALRQAVLPRVLVLVSVKGCPPPAGSRRTGEGLFELRVESEAEIPALVRGLVNAGGEVYRVEARRADLEEVYFALTAHGEEESK